MRIAGRRRLHQPNPDSTEIEIPGKTLSLSAAELGLRRVGKLWGLSVGDLEVETKNTTIRSVSILETIIEAPVNLSSDIFEKQSSAKSVGQTESAERQYQHHTAKPGFTGLRQPYRKAEAASTGRAVTLSSL